jgi:hypothetical protein
LPDLAALAEPVEVVMNGVSVLAGRASRMLQSLKQYWWENPANDKVRRDTTVLNELPAASRTGESLHHKRTARVADGS